ncbi:MAG: carbamoyltransferase HypF [Actinomycetes bacterium]|jgi:hydrogenase maturation protein HypF|nr:carbamoyltransferase HypF [Actinomycetes bacterium]
MKAIKVDVTGVVQGVGFRPFVYGLAGELSLRGWVLNASDGVHIHVEGPDALVDSFPAMLEAKAPPASRIENVKVSAAEPGGFDTFEIRASKIEEGARTFISPDLATCANCRRELFDPDDRRYRYPFINCTDCGPRFTIIRDIPYDRPLTTMADFKMCKACAAEYADPTNRRFHAQPDACWECGPRLYLNDGQHGDWAWTARDEVSASMAPRHRDVADEAARSNSIIIEAAEALSRGLIVAVKGLGGFQLACNARSETTVRRLRERKHRWGKPLAVMFANLEQAERYVELNDAERHLLTGSVRPIVLARRRSNIEGAELALSVAPGMAELGVMLPYTPLHELLLEEFYGPLVMTSGNLSEEPIVTDNARALDVLAPIADVFLLHDRPISERYDDSVVRVVDGRLSMVRRARGYAPQPLPVRPPDRQPASDADATPDAEAEAEAPAPIPILATGSEQKNTFTLLDGGEAFVSQHIGDLENVETLMVFADTISRYERLFRIQPEAIAYDLHPEYLSTKWAKVQEEETAMTTHPLRAVGVQHHHAHVVAAAAEQGEYGPVIGLAFDGTGYGTDGTIWGGEVLLAAAAQPDFERYASLRSFRLPGGAGAVKRPLRTMFSLLLDYGLSEHSGAASLLRRLEPHEGETIRAMVSKGLNSPLCSSMGRLFDAVASLLGVADDAAFEGSPAMMLEAASAPLHAKPASPPQYRFGLSEYVHSSGEPVSGQPSVIIDPEPVIRALLDDLNAMEHDVDCELTTAELARRFHDSVVIMIGDICTKAARATNRDTVAVGGGVFMNRLVLSGAREILETKGMRVLVGEQLPVNDGAISYGQAVIAQAHLSATL